MYDKTPFSDLIIERHPRLTDTHPRFSLVDYIDSFVTLERLQAEVYIENDEGGEETYFYYAGINSQETIPVSDLPAPNLLRKDLTDTEWAVLSARLFAWNRNVSVADYIAYAKPIIGRIIDNLYDKMICALRGNIAGMVNAYDNIKRYDAALNIPPQLILPHPKIDIFKYRTNMAFIDVVLGPDDPNCQDDVDQDALYWVHSAKGGWRDDDKLLGRLWKLFIKTDHREKVIRQEHVKWECALTVDEFIEWQLWDWSPTWEHRMKQKYPETAIDGIFKQVITRCRQAMLNETPTLEEVVLARQEMLSL